MQELTLVVMAAGIGSRYGGLKQMEPVGPSGEAIIDYSIHDAKAAGFDKVVLVIRPDMEEDFRRLVGRRIEEQMETRYCFQELGQVPPGFVVPESRTKPWGTAHAVLAARDAVHGPFAVINADDFYGAQSFQELVAHLRSLRPDSSPPYEHCMVGFALGNTVSAHGSVARGLCEVSPGGFLAGIRELTHIERGPSGIRYTTDGERWNDLADEAIVSMNMWGFDRSVFDEISARFPAFLRERGDDPKSEYFLPSVIMALLSEGRATVRVHPTRERWVGVTHKADVDGVREALSRLVEKKVYPPSLLG